MVIGASLCVIIPHIDKLSSMSNTIIVNRNVHTTHDSYELYAPSVFISLISFLLKSLSIFENMPYHLLIKWIHP